MSGDCCNAGQFHPDRHSAPDGSLAPGAFSGKSQSTLPHVWNTVNIPGSTSAWWLISCITSAAIRLIPASNHRLWNTRDQYWQGNVNTICCHGQPGTRLSRYCIHCAPAFTPQRGQERLLHRKQTFFVWQQSGDEQHHCVYPVSVVPHTMIFVTDSVTTGRTEPSGCFSSQLNQRFPC